MHVLNAQIVSDMAARGLDIEDCDAVLNLELPSNASAYAHRAGRTGRLGRRVVAGQAWKGSARVCFPFTVSRWLD